jgi:hypothetical protein
MLSAYRHLSTHNAKERNSRNCNAMNKGDTD